MEQAYIELSAAERKALHSAVFHRLMHLQACCREYGLDVEYMREISILSHLQETLWPLYLANN